MNEELAGLLCVDTLLQQPRYSFLQVPSPLSLGRKFCIHSSSAADENSDSLAEASARGSNNPEITGPASGDGHVDLAAQFLQTR